MNFHVALTAALNSAARVPGRFRMARGGVEHHQQPKSLPTPKSGVRHAETGRLRGAAGGRRPPGGARAGARGPCRAPLRGRSGTVATTPSCSRASRYFSHSLLSAILNDPSWGSFAPGSTFPVMEFFTPSRAPANAQRSTTAAPCGLLVGRCDHLKGPHPSPRVFRWMNG